MRTFGIVGNCRGKSLLVPQIVGAIGELGISISTLKRVSDDVDLDRPGKESYAHRQAGAQQVLIANSFRWALMTERTELTEPDIADLLRPLKPVDLVLVEGFHLAPIPKCEIIFAGQDRRPIYLDDPSIVAIITDFPQPSNLPSFSPDAVSQIAAFVVATACEYRQRLETLLMHNTTTGLIQRHGHQQIDA